MRSWNGCGSSGVEAGGVDGPICNASKIKDTGWSCFSSCQRKGYCTAQSDGIDKCRWSHCEDDVDFVVAIIDDIKKVAKVDSSKVFASGWSNGAIFAHELAS